MTDKIGLVAGGVFVLAMITFLVATISDDFVRRKKLHKWTLVLSGCLGIVSGVVMAVIAFHEQFGS